MNNTLHEAVQMHQSGDLASAELRYREILAVDPSHADALHLLGLIAYQAGQFDMAVDFIQKAIGRNPMMPHYQNNLGSALLSLERIDEAVRCFGEAVRLKSDYIEAYNNLGNAMKKKGEMEKAKDYYRKATDINPDYLPVLNNLANLLKEEGKLDDSVIYYKKAISLDPGIAETYFNFGNALKDLGRLDDAVEQYGTAIALRPDFAEVYSNLGNILKKKDRYDEAVEKYSKALCLKPDFAEAFNNLSDTYRVLGRFNEAVELCKKAIELKPDFKYAYVNLGNIYLDQGDFSSSIEQYERAIEIIPDYADAHFNLGLVLLMKGELEKGWKEYGWRFKSSEIAGQIGYRDLGIPEWDGSPLEGRTILIKSEQGMGDQIQFARYIPLVKKMGGKIAFECHRELIPLFNEYEGIDVLIEKPFDKETPDIPDVAVQLLNLPSIFNTTADTIIADVPYLKAESGKVNEWKSRLNSALLKVGIVWAGNSNHKNDRNRSCKIDDFTMLLSIPGVELLSLQKGNVREEDIQKLSDMKIRDLSNELNDFSDTASIIENLDLVITVDTSVAHLAGAMGKPVWTLLPYIPDWRWMLDGDDTPWYPTMKLYRQKKHGDWEDVFNRVASDLINNINKRDKNV